jgi:hypothetical protein
MAAGDRPDGGAVAQTVKVAALAIDGVLQGVAGKGGIGIWTLDTYEIDRRC